MHKVSHCICGCSLMVEPQPSKLTAWVRFPSSAPIRSLNSHNILWEFFVKEKVMYNELWYIDVEAFKINECNSKDTMIINEKENHLELKVHNTGKFDCFEVLAGGLGKTTKSKIYYGLNSKNNPITFFDSNISESNYSSINSSTIISNIYAIGIRDNCKHLLIRQS